MQETINRLREQPKEHRTAIAASIAIGVVALLMIGWFFLFMHNLNKGSLEYTRPADTVEPVVNDAQSALVPLHMAETTSAPSTASTTAPASGLNGY